MSELDQKCLMEQSIDKRTIENLKNGDQAAFRTIYNLLGVKIFHFCNKLLPSKNEAEDVVQKTFLALWEQRTQLDSSKDLVKYIYSIARYNTYQAFRNYLLSHDKANSDVDKIIFPQNTTNEEIDFSETQHILTKIIEQLPPKRKEIFKLNRFEGLTYREIATRLNISENTVDTQMRSSLKFIKDEYLKYFSE